MLKRTFAAIAIGAFVAPLAFAQDGPVNRPRANAQAAASATKSSASSLAFRTSDLEGLDVRNKEGETVGSVKDLVVDVETGKIRYVAVSYGGFAGLGDKLFAIPLKQFKVVKDTEDDVYYFSTTLTEEQMKNAPGFDEQNWPAMASQSQWTQQVDQYYGDGDDIDLVAPRVDVDVTPPRVERDR
ncbi:MAG TPA: PRC-barrel domain-containing protein [Pirellulaceae bacterium]|jgi:sporulation protein YlmC with PRC-barrel domain|nr:PRC-barrel domain-containing protein [Pirellulaceae bacterium]